MKLWDDATQKRFQHSVQSVFDTKTGQDHTWRVPSVSIGRPVLSGAHYFKRSQFERRLENALRYEHLIDVAE